MSIPDYQSFMLPLLKLAADGQEHKLSEAVSRLAADVGPIEAHTRRFERIRWRK